MIFEQNVHITPEHLPIRLDSPRSTHLDSKSRIPSEQEMNLEGMERVLLIKALQKAGGNKSQAARVLGITRDTLRYKIQKWDLTPDDYSG